MRFTENGPSIPDALLQARDEGRVVFFCGAGVSQAKAELPNFFGLAEAVIRELGVPPDSDACKVLKKAKELGEELGKELGKELDVTGLISADRVFSLLEREFDSANIQSAVAKCLAPPAEVNRSAHSTLLRLARSPDGKTRVVTTNFDRLFESAKQDVRLFQPPRLPDLSRQEDIDGIVYLHGRTNSEYSGAEGDGFVLSSSDFGHAYLSDGWATDFFRELIRKYVVVFIGYSADDPPVHYLLEGLRRNSTSQNHIYAFQDDKSAELTARWLHKGVQPIPYSPANRYVALWDALEHWATRSDDPVAWRQSVLTRAMSGPRNMQPFERGQVAHVVSTFDGARAFAAAMPPADWLCVFDPACRYSSPRTLNWKDPESSPVDPFVLYGLDSDTHPQRGENDSQYERQTIPSDAWDAFELNKTDLQDSSTEHLASVRGHRAATMPRLPNRLACLGMWIANVAHQQAAVWWAARQASLHPDFRGRIEWRLSQRRVDVDVNILETWRYILDGWESSNAADRREWYDLKGEVDRQGWSSSRARRLVELSTPYLKVRPGLMPRPVPPMEGEECRLSDLVQIEVECPNTPHDAVIPDDWLLHIIRGLRQHIETAVRLCEEVGDPAHLTLCPIEPDNSPGVSSFQRTRELSGCVMTLVKLFERLIVLDEGAAKRELSAWPSDDQVFARLRLWACGKSNLATPHGYAQVVNSLSDEVFWGSYHQRDLLLTLVSRWSDLSQRDRRQIEVRLLKGPTRWKGEDDDSYREHRAWSVLQRLQWMKTQGCAFTFDVDKKIASRKREVPNWKPEYAARSAESREIRSGFVATDTDYSPLDREPIESVLSKAQELSGRLESNHLRERDPFAGLCAERPRRAYLALAHAAMRGEYPAWAWNSFLDSDAREKDEPKFSAIISKRLCRLPCTALCELLYSATWWLRKVSKALSSEYPGCFDCTVQRLADVVRSEQANTNSAVLGSSRGRDWVTEAINSPVGHLVQAVLEDVRMEAAPPTSVGPSLETLGQFLDLTGDPRRHAITLVSRHLGWFHRISSRWTEDNILTILNGSNEDDKDSFWDGFLWDPRISSERLFLQLKGEILSKVKRGNECREKHAQSLSYLTLLGWISSDADNGIRWISDEEFRDVLLHGGDEFRSHVLWQFERALEDKDDSLRKEWQVRANDFFQRVWPRQKAVKTSGMTIKLCELLLSDCDTFDAIIGVVSPLLTSITNGTGMHLHFRTEVEQIAKSRPARFLQLLYQVLPEDAVSWPYGVGDSLEWIVEADGGLAKDTRLIQLRRRWNTR